MNNVAKTQSPTLATTGLFGDDPRLKRVVDDISTNLGHAVTLQDEAGREVPVRINSTTNKQETFINGKWAEMSSAVVATTTSGLSATKTFTDGDSKTHTVVITNGLITSWAIV